MYTALRRHWPEYFMEAASLGLLMVSLCSVVILLGHPASPVFQAISDPLLRRALIGLAVGLTAIVLIYSPWGKQSGAHLNPAVTLAFLRTGKVAPWDAFFYVVAQFAGGVAGVWLMAGVLHDFMAHPSVNYAATAPGAGGAAVAWLAECALSFLLMAVLLMVSNTPHLARFTGVCVGAVLAIFIGLEAPLSGTSLNPARTFGSALPGHIWPALWIYFTAPPLGMVAAAQLYLWHQGHQGIACAKLHHHNEKRCIFCEYHGGMASAPSLP
jgi:aquaporin Z